LGLPGNNIIGGHFHLIQAKPTNTKKIIFQHFQSCTQNLKKTNNKPVVHGTFGIRQPGPSAATIIAATIVVCVAISVHKATQQH
jgi:hypothetical protein